MAGYSKNTMPAGHPWGTQPAAQGPIISCPLHPISGNVSGKQSSCTEGWGGLLHLSFPSPASASEVFVSKDTGLFVVGAWGWRGQGAQPTCLYPPPVPTPGQNEANASWLILSGAQRVSTAAAAPGTPAPCLGVGCSPHQAAPPANPVLAS